MRKYEVDAIRSIAVILLIIYHIVVALSSEITEIGFISLEAPEGDPAYFFILASQALNIWRIPIIFLVAGMGAAFSLKRRSMNQFFSDRVLRISIPLLFGSWFIVPISGIIFNSFYRKNTFSLSENLTRIISGELINPGHLWFLWAICIYIFLFGIFQIFKLLKNDNLPFKKITEKILKKRFGLLLIFSLPLVFLCGITNTESFANHVWIYIFDNLHGFFLGLICFYMGMLFISIGELFWESVRKTSSLCLGLAIIFFILRMIIIFPTFSDGEMLLPRVILNILTAFEASNWILASVGFASRFINEKSRFLKYFTISVYPVYIIHLPVQQFVVSKIVKISLPATIQVILSIFFTLLICYLIFEVIKRIRFFRFFFGMKA
ncbi:MAG: acyltransferase family protein [Dehalococcoidia bacterium]